MDEPLHIRRPGEKQAPKPAPRQASKPVQAPGQAPKQGSGSVLNERLILSMIRTQESMARSLEKNANMFEKILGTLERLEMAHKNAHPNTLPPQPVQRQTHRPIPGIVENPKRRDTDTQTTSNDFSVPSEDEANIIEMSEDGAMKYIEHKDSPTASEKFRKRRDKRP